MSTRSAFIGLGILIAALLCVVWVDGDEQQSPAVKYTNVSQVTGVLSDSFTYCVTADSGSMIPSISPTCILIVTETQDVAVGDIVTYKRTDGLIVHRIVGERGDKWIVSGDNNNWSEEINKSDVICRVDAIWY